MLTAYKSCCLYRAIKLHFSTEYDFIKYNGKVKYTVDQFNKNPHKYVYEKISRKYTDDTIIDFYVSNFLKNENIWVQELLGIESEEIFTQFLKRKQSLFYNFNNDLTYIFENYESGNILNCESGKFPNLLLQLIRNEINLETIVIMDHYMNLVSRWNKKINDDILWPKIKTKILKYRPFITFDKDKFKKVLVDNIKTVIE